MELGTETEAKIIQAATEVFLEKGKDGARMQEIAQKANINKALLHYYFRSKDKLYETVFRERVFRFLDELFSSVPQTDDIKTVLKEFTVNYIDLISAHPERPRRGSLRRCRRSRRRSRRTPAAARPRRIP